MHIEIKSDVFLDIIILVVSSYASRLQDDVAELSLLLSAEQQWFSGRPLRHSTLNLSPGILYLFLSTERLDLGRQ